MRRKPLSFMLLSVLAAISLANVGYAAEGCGCGGPARVVVTPQIVQPPVLIQQPQKVVVTPKVTHRVKHKSIVARPSSHKKPTHRSQVVSLERPKYTMHKRKMVMHHGAKRRVLKPVACFHHIVARNDINIILRNSPYPKVEVLSCDNQCRPLVGYRIVNDTLYLYDNSPAPEECCPDVRPCPRPLQVVVEIDNVNSIQLFDRSSICGLDYHTNQMYVQSHTSGSVMLSGRTNIWKIEQFGSGMIVADGIRRQELDIISRGPGLVKVGGTVDTLHIRALGNAHVDAKFLRAEDAWVQTNGYSEVAVTANYALDGYATDESWVYYYKTPEFETQFDFGHANVVQMAYWD